MNAEFKLDILTERRLIKHLKSLLQVIDIESYNRIKAIIDKAILVHKITLQQINEILEILEKNNKIKRVVQDTEDETNSQSKKENDFFSRYKINIINFNNVLYQVEDELKQFMKCLLYYQVVKDCEKNTKIINKHRV